MRPLRQTLQAKLADQVAQLPKIQEIRIIPHSAPCGGRVFPDFVWGKQSVWLSACRTPTLKGEPGGSPDPLNKPRNGGIECQKTENETKP